MTSCAVPATSKGRTVKEVATAKDKGILLRIEDFPDLMSFIVEFIAIEAPGSKYHSLVPEDIYNIVKTHYPDLTLSQIDKDCRMAYDKGFLVKPGKGYRIRGYCE